MAFILLARDTVPNIDDLRRSKHAFNRQSTIYHVLDVSEDI